MVVARKNLPENGFDNLRAVFINCTLKQPPQKSNTAALMNVAEGIMNANGVRAMHVRTVMHDIPPGVYPDMRQHGYENDEWPGLWEDVIQPAHILVLGSPIWLGQMSSECKKIIERLYGESGKKNEKGQYVFYGKVGGCVVTGNEDGYKHVGMEILYSLQHIGFTIPPQADAAWVGPAGPGPSYLDAGSGGPENDFTQRNATFMAWNLMHLAKQLREAGGIPDYGNDAGAWQSGQRFDHPNPEYR